MATAKEKDDIQTLKTDVALIKQEQKNQTSTLNRVNQKLDNLSFVSTKDYEEDQMRQKIIDDAQNARLDNIEKKINAGGLDAANKLSSGVAKFIYAALVFGLLSLIVWSLVRVTPALGGV